MELCLDRVTKQYRNKIAVDRISITLHKGVYGLIGANGAGKTTLMRMICGILTPDSGVISYDNTDVSDEKYRNVLGYLPQDFGYYPDFTAKQFMFYMASLKGLSKSEAKSKTSELLKLVSLDKMADKKIKTFSGGMKQRLGIAQSLLNDPQVLILDEPTAGLDPKERITFRNFISELGNDRIVILSTHIVSDIENIANTILVMKDGQLIHQGSLSDIIGVIEGKVFECTADDSTADKLMSQYPVVNIRTEESSTFLRLICEECPTPDAVNVNATLEDLYMYYFNEVTINE